MPTTEHDDYSVYIRIRRVCVISQVALLRVFTFSWNEIVRIHLPRQIHTTSLLSPTPDE